MVDVHKFDGKLCKTTIPDRSFSIDEKRIRIGRIECMFPEGSKERKYCSLILNDIDSPGNHSTTDGLRAEDLLIEIGIMMDEQTSLLKRIKEMLEIKSDDVVSVVIPSILNLLTEQLRDMETGSCPAGRVNRLFSVYLAFQDIRDLEGKIVIKEDGRVMIKREISQEEVHVATVKNPSSPLNPN